jgi:glutamate formiminotransferase/formiminotetrahydrofolate cyclodeaminase
MAECVQLASELAERVGKELKIPVYLYEEAATRPERRNLATIRKGEYEGLAKKLADPEWKPDFGPAVHNATSGATVIGAREFLIAYNFNLNTRDTKIANRIAFAIREAGRKGTPGKFKHVKAVGWYMQDFDCAQVSMNLTNYKETKLAAVFDEVCRQAESHGVRCTGSELVGLIPKDCLLEAGRHFLIKANKNAGVPENELIRLAVQSLGLSELYPFEPKKKIIENSIQDPRPLIEMPVAAFCDLTSTDSPAPGGGSVAAVCAAMASALACMVAQLTSGKKGYENAWEEMNSLAEETQAHKDFFLRAVDDDTAAFNEVMAAFRMPKKTDEQKTARLDAIQAATKKATEVPMNVLRRLEPVSALVHKTAHSGNKNSLSDAGVAALCTRAAAEGARYNVLINLDGLEDTAYTTSMKQESDQLIQKIRQTTKEVATHLEKTLT